MSYVQRYNKIVAWLGIRMFFCLTHLSACAVNMLGATSVIVLRACLETHLSIMKRFNSMLAMAI